jgi:plastocyanin
MKGSHMPSRRGGHGLNAARLAIPGCLLLFFGCAQGPATPPSPPPGAISPGQSIGQGAIEGRVTFSGTPPVRRAIRMTSEAACHKPGAETLSEDVIVAADGSLRNVLVHVTSGLGDRVFAPPLTHVVMDQNGCAFKPHLLDAQSNQLIDFGNADPVLHNVRGVATKNPGFNISMPANGKIVSRYFTIPEVVKIRCDIHAWMGAYVSVDSHPFHQVTQDSGAFALRGLPAGEYVIEAWHEKLGAQQHTVRLAEGETQRIDFTFPAKAAP